ncbi:UDP-N-acetylmuramoyl-L-alanyl-D-glutamate--2,6-diaminopimelate ligase [Arcanobacterium haemolyticum]|uniref:UDP-N-acetylmuramyl-tripeptide synthetase n=1 Tax=Arcanobacterium haemolyticum (strain ATCC 9345 / DSM 20595 / CCM 5947 / CCUG 17215 / LMG 16163 / NBRC 15585 / NCTC 8452 / 11018) TaxID=644284 RepID=D7BNA4_ARCHD|nr:UDP-N-acetylmuramoyl-L-alanyl-D-glutamate--2,6-diaminopimelate ligase [Arcanobacterium haemolyticum]ADH92403.1 UDP-N-acetylmuramyl-tripeptide synthetase [Arcanobacterium haemolyticum DSM 20595]QCX46538.1 UDP-N-acetylmuramoyl-L-alanyl-D-glutamate--2,6-diaminopimelate ligase [Arcanobacterium haemolyticum]SQH28869.1 UDP-N-acetylmuramoyl-L-alanyl-D-glutamate--2,6-diaminopimelate ligase [Arcanobacterium haemolyticum]
MIRPVHVTSTRLGELIASCPAEYADVAITGATADNRQVEPGDLFFAIPGATAHGARYANSAVASGAVAVITDTDGADFVTADVPVIILADVARHVGDIAAAVYGFPAQKLTTYAVTGTNGKTTTAFMIDHILNTLGETTGLIGTVAVKIAGQEIPAQLTTPQPADLQAMLAALVERGGTSLVMEVSSHAIAQGRIESINYSVAGFTNLTQDHLDYHNTLTEYFEAKALLFTEKFSRVGVAITDTPWGEELVKRGNERVAALASQPDQPAGWRFTGQADGTLTLRGENWGTITTSTNLPGDFNIANAALAIAMVAKAGYSAEAISAALLASNGVNPQVPGRMEVVAEAPRIVVDFAHNEDALTKAIEALRPSTQGNLIVITGSAGDRDVTKRPLMAKTVAERADVLVITDDDPHSEDPAHIRADLIAGIPTDTNWIEIADRREAITAMVTDACAEDTILIAGRGHETIQDMNGTLVNLDDREVAREAHAKRRA